jgi:hypothetical protein
VRPAAQVLPAQPAGLGIEVVVDGQVGPAHLDVLAIVGRRRAFEADELLLVGLTRQLCPGLLLGHHPAAEPLALLDDRPHPLLDGLQVLGGERSGDIEVVVEAVLHRRADSQLGVREQLLHRLRHHVRRGVAQDVPSVGRSDLHRLHGVSVGQRGGQVAQVPVHPGGDNPRALDHGGGRRARLDHMLAACEGDTKLLAGHGGLLRG